MNIEDRVKAATYRIVAAFIGIIALLKDCGFFELNIKIYSFMYFTIISNFLCFLMFTILGVKTIYDIRKDGRYGISKINPHLKGMIIVSIVLTMCIYHFILIPYALSLDPTRRFKIADIILHYIIPFLTIGDWILFDEKRSFKIFDPFLWTCIPVIYVAFVFIQTRLNLVQKMGVVMDKYIYAFLNLETLGKYGVAKNIMLIFAFLLLIGYFIYGIDRIKIQNDEKFLKKI